MRQSLQAKIAEYNLLLEELTTLNDEVSALKPGNQRDVGVQRRLALQ